MRVGVFACFSGCALLLASCSGNPKPAPPPEPTDTAQEVRVDPPALVVESEVGALDKDAIKEAFGAATPELEACVAKGRRDKQPLLGGTIEAFLQIDGNGKAQIGYLTQSTLGDHTTEACIVNALKARTWPKPQGGKVGETRQQLELGEPDTRSPVPWSDTDLGKGFVLIDKSLRQCRRKAGAGPMEVTFYVEPTKDGFSGRAKTAGVSMDDEKGLKAIDCLVKTLLGGHYPSPGSYAAKVSVMVQ